MVLKDNIYTMTKYEKEISLLLSKFNQNIVIIAHSSGYTGGLVYRILAADSNFYWSKDISGIITDENYEPLRWPNKTEGFKIYGLDNDKQAYVMFKMQHLSTCHVQIPLIEHHTIEHIKENIRIITSSNKKLILRTHDMDIRKINNNIKILRIVGNLPDRFNPRGFRDKNITIENHINTYNLNINNLLSTDYNIFIDEYLKLCTYFDLEPMINSVRSFILMWLDKQTRGHYVLPQC